ncbi:MAG: PH domain-containing protein [Pirellulaceae bacterium]
MLPEAGPNDSLLIATTEDTKQRQALATLSEPSFLHPSSILFQAASHIRKFLFPAIVAVFSAASGGVWGIGIALVLFGGALVATLVRYFTLRYRVQGEDFVVTEGLLFRRVRSVPIRRIQNVDLVQNVLHRVFGVAEVRIETASGTEPEATLRVLTSQQIQQLRDAIFGTQETHPVTNAAIVQSDGALREVALKPQETSQQLHHCSPKQLVLAGLTSNRGMILLSVAVGIYFQNRYTWNPGESGWIDSRWFQWPREQLASILPGNAGPIYYAIVVLGAFIVLMLALRIFGAAWYILRFYDHQLSRHGEDLQISCGLLTKVSATIPRKRIQFISVHRTWLMRPLGLASIRVETAGGGGKAGEDAAATVSRRWFLPVVAWGDVPRLLSQLRPGLIWDDQAVAWQAVSPRTSRRLMRMGILICLAISVGGFFAWQPWGGMLGLVCFPGFAWLAIKKSRAMRYARTDWGVAYRSGLFTRKLSFAFYDRIQTLGLQQSPFDRRWQMATLAIDTAAAGPAEHVIAVSYLDADFARQQFEDLQHVLLAQPGSG